MFLFVNIIHDGGEDRGFDLPHLCGTILFADNLVESSETSSESGIKVIFDVVIGAK